MRLSLHFCIGCLLLWSGEALSGLQSLAIIRSQNGSSNSYIKYSISRNGSYDNTRLAASKDGDYSDLLSAYGTKKGASPESLPSGDLRLPSDDLRLPSVDVPLPSGDVPLSSSNVPLPSSDVPIPSSDVPISINDVQDLAAKTDALPLFQKFKVVEAVKEPPSGEKAPAIFDYLSSKYSATEKLPPSENSESAINWLSGFKPKIPDTEPESAKNIADYIGIRAPQYKVKIPDSTEKVKSFADYAADKIDIKVKSVDGASENVQNIASYVSGMKVKAIEKVESTEKVQTIFDYLSTKSADFKSSGGLENGGGELSDIKEKFKPLIDNTAEFVASIGTALDSVELGSIKNTLVGWTASTGVDWEEVSEQLQLDEYGVYYAGFLFIIVASSLANKDTSESEIVSELETGESNVTMGEMKNATAMSNTTAEVNEIISPETTSETKVDTEAAVEKEETPIEEVKVDEKSEVIETTKVETGKASEEIASIEKAKVETEARIAEEKAAAEKAKAEMKKATEKKAAAEKAKAEMEKVTEGKAAAEKAKAEMEKVTEGKAAAEKAKAEMEKVIEEKASFDRTRAEMEAKIEEGRNSIEEAKSNMEVAIEMEKATIENKKAEMEKVAEERAALEKTKLDMVAATDRVRTEMMKEVEKISEEKATLEKAKADLEATIAEQRVAAERAKAEMEKVVQERTSYEKAKAEMEVEVEKVKVATKALEAEKTAMIASGPEISEQSIQDTDQLKSTTITEKAVKKVVKKKKVLKEKTSKSPKGVKGVSEGGEIDEFASLTPAALKRKTVKELTSYLSKRGITVTDENGKPLKKAILLEAVNNL